MKRRTLLQLTTLAVSLPLALSPAQQPVASPNWADTIAWINNAISENAHMSYSSIAGFDPSQSEQCLLRSWPKRQLSPHIRDERHCPVQKQVRR
jgi:hypothetical protein